MENITNAKIEKAKADMDKTKAKIAEYQTKYREQERHLRNLEDLEIVARFRSVKTNEDYFLNKRQNNAADSVVTIMAANDREAEIDESIEN